MSTVRHYLTTSYLFLINAWLQRITHFDTEWSVNNQLSLFYNTKYNHIIDDLKE